MNKEYKEIARALRAAADIYDIMAEYENGEIIKKCINKNTTKTPVNNKIGGVIKNIRIQTGLTQTDVANKLGITQPTYARYENGKITPQYETRVKIAAALGIPVSMLLVDYGE